MITTTPQTVDSVLYIFEKYLQFEEYTMCGRHIVSS